MKRMLILPLLLFIGAADTAMAQAIPAPPRRPAELGSSAEPSAPATSPAAGSGPMRLQTERPVPMPPGVAAGPTRAPTAIGPLSDQEALEKVNAYMNSFRTLIADFVQIGADGRRFTGKLYIQRPGRMRFEYRPPATIEVISDGTTVAVRDKRLGTQDPYLIGQTPLKFLLKEQIDLKRDVKVTRISSTPDMISVTVEDTATLGGTSRITLQFDRKANVLKQWMIVDPQGYETSVQVANLDTTQRPDPALFRINLERVLDTRN
ncbi:MAG: outer-membrane lipoprotein carrier protein LolA [Hyphomicrobiales bacterium]|nr:outer-membrane lipoprotein carrier protein LolA [Hyphomicrobiales bacterium]